MKDNARYYPYLIAWGTLAALYALSFAPIDDYRLLGIDLKPVTLPFRQAPAAPETPVSASTATVLQPLAPSMEPAAAVLASAPSGTVVSEQTLSSSLTFTSFVPVAFSLQTPSTLGGGLLVDYGNNVHFFQQALREYSSKNGDQGMIRIAYVGDSLIEGDVITKDLRALLQRRFGGSGTGFMKIIAEDAPFRSDIRHSFSGDWTVESMNRNSAHGPFWLGPMFVSGPGSWVNYEVAGKSGPGHDCYLLYRGDGTLRRITVAVNNGPGTQLDLDPAEGMHFIKVHGRGEGTLRKIRLTFETGIRAYGVSFQSDTGVYVDNYSLRGHKGLELARVSPDVAGQVLRYSPYKLIILQFGVNVAYAEADGFRRYEKGIGGVISHLRRLFPETGILVVSTTDRCVRDGESIVSDSDAPDLMQAQHRAAAKEGVAFFDLYHAMGGTGSMSAWVKQGYAFKDYTHISRRGGRKIAELLFGMLTEPVKP